MHKGNSNALSHDPVYKLLLGALLGSVVGILLDTVQRGPLCSAVVLSQIFSTHLEVEAPPILYVFVIFVVGVSLALFSEQKVAHKTLMIAAGFTTFLQTSVPIPIPTLGVEAEPNNPTAETAHLPSMFQLISIRKGEMLLLETEDEQAIGDILLRFDHLDHANRSWSTFFVDLKGQDSRIAIDLSNTLSRSQLNKYYDLTVEVPGYKIVTVGFLAQERASLDKSIAHVVRIDLEPTFVPLFVQRLFITPPSEQPIPEEFPV